MKNLIPEIEEAHRRLKGIAGHTPLQLSNRLSTYFGAKIFLKREDLQQIRSFKIRGAYNLISSRQIEARRHQLVCASAGNHAQGVALACSLLGIQATIFMPETTPHQKIDRVREFGGSFVTVTLVGDSYDQAQSAAQSHSETTGSIMVHPFDDPLTIAGQGTIGKEIGEDMDQPLDFLIAPIGGGGLISGIASYLKPGMPDLTIIGAQPASSLSMHASLKAGKPITLKQIDTFTDGAAVKRVGDLTFEICKTYLDSVVLVPEGAICKEMISLYQSEGIIAEPAGALAIAALELIKERIRHKCVVCILSGGNNDISRYPEIVERSLIHMGLKHYFLVEFVQKPGQLRAFVDSALGSDDDIVRFEYLKKTSKEHGLALVGIELKNAQDLQPLVQRMDKLNLNYQKLDSSEALYDYLV